MSFVLTEEQEAIRRTARELVQGKAPTSVFRALRDSADPLGYARPLWQEMAALGLAGAIIPESYGGAGLGFTELGLVLEECGRTLAPTPLLSTSVLGAGALLMGGSEAQRRAFLPAIAAGERIMALAHEEGARHAPFRVATRAERAGDGHRITGDKVMVLDGHVADALVVVARTSGPDARAGGERHGLTLFLIPARAPGVTIARSSLVDSRNAARVRFDAVHAAADDVIGEVDLGADVLEPLLDRAAIALAAEMLGGMSAAFERTVAYLKERKQFGAPIGSFQALQHRAAHMLCEIELTRSIVMEALGAIDRAALDVAVLASAAKARASETYLLVANEAIQMHGGIGVTDEHDIGFYLKRARVAAMTLGTAAYHRDRFGRLRGY